MPCFINEQELNTIRASTLLDNFRAESAIVSLR